MTLDAELVAAVDKAARRLGTSRSAFARDALRAALADGDISLGPVGLLVLFVGLFAAGLVILGLATAWRSAVWTVVVARGGPTSAGTFGGGTDTRSGD